MIESKMAAISKEEYLKRYLSNTDADVTKKRKKKVKKPVKAGKSRIIDDDVNLSDIKTQNEEETSGNLFDIAEETPLIYDEAGSTVLSKDLNDIKKEEDAKKALWAPVKNISDEEIANNQRSSRHDSPNLSPLRQSKNLNRSREKFGRRHDSPDQSPVRKHQRQSDSDQSPPRKGRVHSGTPDLSPRRKLGKRSSPSPDLSPARQRTTTHNSRANTRTRHDSPDMSPPRQRKRQSTPDLSPERQRNTNQRTKVRSRYISPDLSPPRKITNRNLSPEVISQKCDNEHTRRRNDTPSPPRGEQRRSQRDGSKRDEPRDQSLLRQNKTKHHGSPKRRSSPDLSPKRKDFSKHARKAGLHSAEELKQENEMSRRKEDEMFAKMSSSSTGKGAETIHRDKEGKKRDLKVEKAQKKEKERQKMEEDEKFMEWGKGLQQSKNLKDKVEDEIYEMSKPLARYKDDKDLDKMLKEKERSEDPMLAFIQKRKTKQDIATGKKEKPRYKGPPPPPNRFNIQPGYRWDGVDRSNGFEKKRFTMLANKGSTRKEAYKWSTEDM